ncbi:MAG TPA: phosphoglycerate kinase [candidate division Zixibacteria bacterium]|jgi:phosphoglycerate kinase
MPKKTIADLPSVKGRRVLARVDFNVPIDDGRVTDDARVRSAIPTIRALSKAGAHLVLMSHLGRPKGKRLAEMSLWPVAAKLGELLGTKVSFARDCAGGQAERAAASLSDGDILLLENLRFHPEEEQNDDAFSRDLARLGDIYVNDAFGAAHRAHASTVGVTRHLKPCVAGLLMQKELEYLGGLLSNPRRPFYSVLGGAKVSGKLEVISHLLDKADGLLIGGGMAFTFLRAEGHEVGQSLVESDLIEQAAGILRRARELGCDFQLPVDGMAGADRAGTPPITTVDVRTIPRDLACFDIGPKTANQFEASIEKLGNERGTVFWNGPMGVFETVAFATGTKVVGEAIARASRAGATTVVGGGDSVAAIHQLGIAPTFTHVSTGGGASLEFIEGKILPGVAALDDAD